MRDWSVPECSTGRLSRRTSRNRPSTGNPERDGLGQFSSGFVPMASMKATSSRGRPLLSRVPPFTPPPGLRRHDRC